ncbi:MAG: sigma-54 dependent transcriptional regulator, partial [Fibrobacterales bacterium]
LLNEKFIGRINDLIRPPYHYHILHSRLKQVVNEVSMINNNRILVVDDDPMVLKSLKRSLLEAPFSIEYEDTAEKALEHIRQEEFAVILSDIQMPGIDGVEFLGRSKEFSSDSVRMVLSGTGNMDVVVSLINHGDVWRYIEKPWDVNDLIITLKNGVELFAMRKEKQHLRSENITLKNVLHRNTELQGFSSNAPAMQKVIRTIDKVANLDSLVLIQGESGTGKELAAQMVHAKSNRALEPFVVVDCGAQSATLFESELFGHVKGAFTGAQADRKGLLEQAGNGTLFFDEIGELPLEMQTRLLRAIQEKQIRPVGETAYRPFKSRIVAATNRNLKEMVVEGSFREDLYYRLNVITLGLPPLRKRNEDISELVHFFISRHSSANSDQYVDESTLNALKNYSW